MVEYRCPCIVNLGRTYDPSFVYRIDGKGPEFGFTLKPIPEEKRDWFAGVVMGVIDRAYEHGQETKVAEIQRGLATTLAAMGLEFSLPKRGG